MRRRVLIGLAVVAFLAVSFALARFLTTEGGQRGAILGLLQDQARGDARAVLDRLEDCDAPCAADVRAAAARLKGAGTVDVVRIDSDVSYTLGSSEGWARVVWTRDPAAAPVVQCVRVRRKGNPVTGRSTTLLRLTQPLADNEGSC